MKLTPTEIRVANFIRQGRTTKEISNLMNLSAKTVEFHRDNIRTKIGIKTKKINLRTHLLSLY
jgi:DNA-binding CsgD family transcriptional regulator